ncbi:hypothetical protein R8Z50_31900 [Longispora sp. K20-0274]|uniref:hypothetical protein n=1 Tax=Longispora sp. K20-0274 TaxID=3088255 RepID=UPI00399BD3BD
MTTRKPVLALGAVLGAVVGLMVTFGTAASAAPAAGDAASTTLSAGSNDALLACVLKAYKPTVGGHTVRAGAESAGCAIGYGYNAQLQRSRWWGWETITDTSWSGNSYHALSKGCKAGDTYTYKVYAYNRNGGGSVNSPTTRATC